MIVLHFLHKIYLIGFVQYQLEADETAAVIEKVKMNSGQWVKGQDVFHLNVARLIRSERVRLSPHCRIYLFGILPNYVEIFQDSFLRFFDRH